MLHFERLNSRIFLRVTVSDLEIYADNNQKAVSFHEETLRAPECSWNKMPALDDNVIEGLLVNELLSQQITKFKSWRITSGSKVFWAEEHAKKLADACRDVYHKDVRVLHPELELELCGKITLFLQAWNELRGKRRRSKVVGKVIRSQSEDFLDANSSDARHLEELESPPRQLLIGPARNTLFNSTSVKSVTFNDQPFELTDDPSPQDAVKVAHQTYGEDASSHYTAAQKGIPRSILKTSSTSTQITCEKKGKIELKKRSPGSDIEQSLQFKRAKKFKGDDQN
ncbi:hypothetical protein BXZ70DRAFT_911657 [Cristinia sonorae]|uniref:Uncharacterized protein n=1 Tax=Cristinia sonorae TaxID=1940300 RepID=A0A8K0UD93_9AGAR|nr:hypothetical protein BXZ70DRAFT_911657 [Cristinia sonorae]